VELHYHRPAKKGGNEFRLIIPSKNKIKELTMKIEIG
jgi:hypothetical protein